MILNVENRKWVLPLLQYKESHFPVSLLLNHYLSPSVSVSMAPGDIDSSADFHQLVQAHQAVAARLPPLEEIHTLLDRSTRGMLSTFSQFDEAADRYSFMAKMLGISWID